MPGLLVIKFTVPFDDRVATRLTPWHLDSLTWLRLEKAQPISPLVKVTLRQNLSPLC